MHLNKIAFAFLAAIVLFSCSNDKKAGSASWSSLLEHTGTYSSARTVDLNNDNVLDIVIGAGGKRRTA
ncbi:MAG: hypothetical protein WDO16_20405 [Bacteroidota bacterium]